MKTETPRRQIAQEIAAKWNAYANLIDAVEDILKDRDERAAKIAEGDDVRCEPGNCHASIAAAIRAND